MLLRLKGWFEKSAQICIKRRSSIHLQFHFVVGLMKAISDLFENRFETTGQACVLWIPDNIYESKLFIT